jgi:hypothetical protein
MLYINTNQSSLVSTGMILKGFYEIHKIQFMACRLGFLWFSMTENKNFPTIFGESLPYQISTSLKK